MNNSGAYLSSTIILILLSILLSGCPIFEEPTYSVGGTLSGLLPAQSVTLYNNGDESGDHLTLTNNGSFTFSSKIADVGKYGVTVATQPGTDYCAVANSSGFINGADITDVQVVCAAPQTVNISGVVKASEGGALLPNVSVEARYAANGNIIDFTTTDALGNYSLAVNVNQDFFLHNSPTTYNSLYYYPINMEILNEIADRNITIYLPDENHVSALETALGVNLNTDSGFAMDVKDVADNGIAGVTVSTFPPVSHIYYNTGSGYSETGPTTTASSSPSVVGVINEIDPSMVGTYTVTLSGNTSGMMISNPIKFRLVPQEISVPYEP